MGSGNHEVETALTVWKKDNGITWNSKNYESKCHLDNQAKHIVLKFVFSELNKND